MTKFEENISWIKRNFEKQYQPSESLTKADGDWQRDGYDILMGEIERLTEELDEQKTQTSRWRSVANKAVEGK